MTIIKIYDINLKAQQATSEAAAAEKILGLEKIPGFAETVARGAFA
jgi:hypothetical protein